MAAFALIALITLILLLTCKDDNPKPQNGEMEEVKKEVNDANNNSGNLQQNTQKDNNADTDVKSNTSEPQNVKQEEQVDKVVFDGVKPLEIIVTEHYGDHDKVFQVIMATTTKFSRSLTTTRNMEYSQIGPKFL